MFPAFRSSVRTASARRFKTLFPMIHHPCSSLPWRGLLRVVCSSLAPLSLWALVQSSAWAAASQAPVPAFAGAASGGGGTFEVALDELYSSAHGGFQPIAEVAGLAQLQAVAAASGEARGGEFAPVLYLKGSGRSEQTARIATSQILAQLADGANPVEIARAARLGWVSNPGMPAGYFLFQAASPADALTQVASLRQVPGVTAADPMLGTRYQPMGLSADPLEGLQWHLVNPIASGGDIPIDIGGITNVWSRFRGEGMVIAIVDTGVDYLHPDLAPHYVTRLQHDYADNDRDPFPDVDAPGHPHGTAVAGCAAAVGNNRLGVVGVAYEAQITGLRILNGRFVSDANTAACLSHSNSVIHVMNNSWGKGDPFGLAAFDPLTRAAVHRASREGRGGRGLIHLFSAGNSAQELSDANYGYSSCIDVISVGAISYIGDRCSYSEQGACLAISAPSGDQFRGDLGLRGILTTDMTGANGYNPPPTDPGDEEPDVNYTRQFNGTSAAAPIASGVVALVLQSNPELRYRDLKEVLMRTAKVVQPADPDWSTNSSGLHHNHQFGAGLINADGAVRLAQDWQLLGPETNVTVAARGLPIAIPDNNPSGVSFDFVVTNSNLRVEHATITLTAPHPSWGDLEVTLVSPKRVRSRLTRLNDGRPGYAYRNWELSSVRHWGEAGEGVWRVVVADRRADEVGSVTGLSLTLYGSTPRVSLSGKRTKDGVLLTCSSAAPGWKAVVESSSNLKDWAVLRQVTISDNGRGLLSDRSPEAPFARFYRVRPTP